MRILNLIALVTFVTAGSAAAQPSSPGRGMDMNAFMERCAELRQQPGSSQSLRAARNWTNATRWTAAWG